MNDLRIEGISQRKIPGLVNVTKSYGKSQFLMGKSTINGHFNSFVYVHQRVIDMI